MNGSSESYLPRLAQETLFRALGVSPVVVLMGARQTGKSSLVQSEPFGAEHGDRLYLTLDDLATRDRAVSSPDDVRSLQAFRDEYPDLVSGGLLLHDGDEIQ